MAAPRTACAAWRRWPHAERAQPRQRAAPARAPCAAPAAVAPRDARHAVPAGAGGLDRAAAGAPPARVVLGPGGGGAAVARHAGAHRPAAAASRVADRAARRRHRGHPHQPWRAAGAGRGRDPGGVAAGAQDAGAARAARCAGDLLSGLFHPAHGFFPLAVAGQRRRHDGGRVGAAHGADQRAPPSRPAPPARIGRPGAAPGAGRRAGDDRAVRVLSTLCTAVGHAHGRAARAQRPVVHHDGGQRGQAGAGRRHRAARAL